jgi:ribosomal protein S27E
MSEAVAQKKFHCPTCGAEATWNPEKQALICGYCGTVSPAKLDTTPGGDAVIREHDLVAALRGIPDEARGWKADKVQVRCQSCQAISVFDPERVAQRCDFCGSSAMIPYTEAKEPFSPESLLMFKIAENDVRELLKRWLRGRFWAPGTLSRLAVTDRLRGVYLPYWTFDANADADWWAESGWYYDVEEVYTDANGQTQRRTVRQIRWEPSAGHLSHFFDDELVCASKGVDRSLIEAIGGYPTKELVPYDSGFVAGWVVERYQIDLPAAAQASRERMEGELEAMCGRQVPGDTWRNLRVDATWTGQTFKHTLLPVWLLTYDYSGRSYQVLVNGYTGAVAGRYPKSWAKILIAILAVLFFAALIVYFGRR